MERLWIPEVRRAALRASAPFARQVALGAQRSRSERWLPLFCPALGWTSGASRVGRAVGSGWLRCHLDRVLHLSPVQVSIKRISRPQLACATR
jgi:hypothetical protein